MSDQIVPERAGRENDSQPLPVASDSPVMHRLVQDDLDARLQIGIQRYGQPLQAWNGRNALRDAYEEILDLAVYTRQALYEHENRPATIDAAHLERQRAWSRETFGPDKRTLGVLDHIRKELAEIEADPDDLGEWVDVIILAFDGAWRHGWEPQQIIDAIQTKQATNETRVWPDWRTMSADEAIEHDRSFDAHQDRH